MTVVDDFAADYFVREGLTPGRRRDVLRALRTLEEHAGAAPETLNERQVDAWVTARVAGGLHVNTVRKELKCVKPFYRWCWRQHIIDMDRFERIRELQPPRGSTGNATPRPYKPEQIHRFWDELDARWPLSSELMLKRYRRGTSKYRRMWKHARHLQAQAVASLALFGGLRHAEIRHAGIDDIHPDNDFIVVRGKSPFGERNGYREVPYTETGRQMVGEWLEFRDLIGPTHHQPWLVLTATASPNSTIPSHPFNPISDDGFAALMPAIGAWELHRFRHTCATEWLRAGADLEVVQRLMGHATLQQTLCYAQLITTDVARGLRRVEGDFMTVLNRRNNDLLGGANGHP
jgi:site-specific recombinase XerD